MMQGKIQVLILPMVSELLSGYMCNEVIKPGLMSCKLVGQFSLAVRYTSSQNKCSRFNYAWVLQNQGLNSEVFNSETRWQNWPRIYTFSFLSSLISVNLTYMLDFIILKENAAHVWEVLYAPWVLWCMINNLQV